MQNPKPSPTPDAKIYYPAFKAHDARFDGRVFVGVSSTGIYCRPVCRVKMPKEENCTFYHGAAAAEAAGYRPCLKCRPELAPGFAPVDAAGRLSQKAALLIEEDGLCESSLTELACELDVTDRHLRRVFASEYGVSPVRYLQTYRLLLAKSLLTDTLLPVTDVAFAAGFGSVRRFNALFRQHYHLSPSSLRKQVKDIHADGRDSITLFLGYRPPYRWDAILTFLAGRAIPGVEAVADGAYYRTAALHQGGVSYRGWISVRHAEKKNALAVTVSSTLLPVLPKTLARVKHLFDLQCGPEEVFNRLAAMNELQDGLCVCGMRLPGCFDAFEMSVRAVLGQQVTVKAARTLAARVAAAYGTEIETPIAGLTHTFPAPVQLCDADELLGRGLGITGTRARCIGALAAALVGGEVELSRSADPGLQMKKLLGLPGFGEWTVQYIAMRALGWPDAFPHTDYGVKKALGDRTPKERLELAERWRPWRSYATIQLWNSL